MNTSNNSKNKINTNKTIPNEISSHKRLIDNMSSVKHQFNISNDKKCDESEVRKTIKREKIEINCENTNYKKDEQLDKEFLDSLSNEKKKFFMFRVREVYDFLSSINLLRFIATFIEDGLEDMECILGKSHL